MQKISSTQKVEVMRTVKVLSKLVITKLPDIPTWGLMVDNLRREIPPYLSFSMYFYYFA